MMLTNEFRYCLRQTAIILAVLVMAPASYLLDSTQFHAGFGLLFYISNFVGLALLALALLMALTVFGRENRDGALEYLLSLPVGRWKFFICKTVPRCMILLALLVPHQLLLHIRLQSLDPLGGCILPFSFTNNLALMMLLVLLGFLWGVIGGRRTITGLVLLTTVSGLWVLYPWGFVGLSPDNLGIGLLKLFASLGLRDAYLFQHLSWTMSLLIVAGLLTAAFLPIYRKWGLGSARSRETAFLRLAVIPFLFVCLTVVFMCARITI
jgi:hypothetical protein